MRKADKLVTKSGKLNFLEPSGPDQASDGTDLPLPFTTILPLVVLYTFIEAEEEFAAIMFRVAQEVFMDHSEDGASKIGRIKSSIFHLFSL